MNINGHYALCFKIHGVFGAYHKKLYEDRSKLVAAGIKPNDSSFWQYKVYGGYSQGFPGKGRQT